VGVIKRSLQEEIFKNTVKPAVKTAENGDARAVAYWQKCLEIIGDNVSPQIFKTWFSSLEALRYKDGILILKSPSQFFCEWIEDNYFDLLSKTVKQVIGENAKIDYEVIVEDINESLESGTIKVPGLKNANKPKPQGTLPFDDKTRDAKPFRSNLNTRYSFDNFVTGDSNQLASGAAYAVSQNPGKTRFNPLFVYGDTGLGKTHLVQAIGNMILSENPKSRVLYTNSEIFTMEFIKAIQNNKVSDFVNYYRNIDVLIVDDIQFLAEKERTQDNFFHTFNALHQAGKQLVLTSDKPPKELKDVDERLISRFQWGLSVDIQMPDLEMRMAILQKKSQDEGIDLPQDIVEYIARHVKTSVRELEGTLVGLIAKTTLDKKSLDMEIAKQVVHGVGNSEPKPLTVEDIKREVADYYKLTVEQLESKSRKHEITLGRQMSIYFAKLLTQNSLKSIGSYFGGRDHSTVLHSCNTIENYLVTDKTVKNDFELLRNKLKDM
jgi:chromosomal replication initiator protein